MTKEIKSALEFRKGGVLIYNNWVYDEVKGAGSYIPEDITKFGWIHKRDKHVEFAPDVTLNDVFLFLEHEPEICDIVFHNCYIKEYVNKWKNTDKSCLGKEVIMDRNNIENLELYWSPELFTFEGRTEISDLSLASFHGQGFSLVEEDIKEENFDFYKVGDRINWALDFKSLDEILNLPIKLNTEFVVYSEWGVENTEQTKLLDCHRNFTFIEAIQGIMWEISFYGTEEEKLEKKEYILDLKSEIDESTEVNA